MLIVLRFRFNVTWTDLNYLNYLNCDREMVSTGAPRVTKHTDCYQRKEEKLKELQLSEVLLFLVEH